MMYTIKARWQNWEGNAAEDMVLNEAKEGIFVESTITNIGKENFTVRYTITCDVSWKVKEFTVELVGKGKKIQLESDGLGHWSDDTGIITKLNGAIDIDISATPFTNTLPIRRLKLSAGQSAEISVVYITVLEFDISLDRQKYTCIIPNRLYRYESLESDFVREIEVDENGLVLLYPGLFKRIQ